MSLTDHTVITGPRGKASMPRVPHQTVSHNDATPQARSRG